MSRKLNLNTIQEPETASDVVSTFLFNNPWLIPEFVVSVVKSLIQEKAKEGARELKREHASKGRRWLL